MIFAATSTGLEPIQSMVSLDMKSKGFSTICRKKFLLTMIIDTGMPVYHKDYGKDNCQEMDIDGQGRIYIEFLTMLFPTMKTLKE